MEYKQHLAYSIFLLLIQGTPPLLKARISAGKSTNFRTWPGKNEAIMPGTSPDGQMI
jgi:hypothetical protein